MTVTAAGDGPAPPESTPASSGRRWWRAVMLPASLAGLPVVVLLPRLGRPGGLLVTAACGVLSGRDVTLTVTGAPARLRPAPRLLLFAEVAVSAAATVAGLRAWGWRRPGAARAATAAAAATFALHSVRVAIYLSPGSGTREQAGQ